MPLRMPSKIKISHQKEQLSSTLPPSTESQLRTTIQAMHRFLTLQLSRMGSLLSREVLGFRLPLVLEPSLKLLQIKLLPHLDNLIPSCLSQHHSFIPPDSYYTLSSSTILEHYSDTLFPFSPNSLRRRDSPCSDPLFFSFWVAHFSDPLLFNYLDSR